MLGAFSLGSLDPFWRETLKILTGMHQKWIIQSETKNSSTGEVT
jgi:hypothetical protein